MNRRVFLLCAALCTSAFSAAAQQDSLKLDVQVTYTGPGTVDADHKVFVVLWDTPDFVSGNSGGPPIAVQSVSAKTDTAHFDNLGKSPVYVSMVYDPSGKWDAASPPPANSSIGLYSTEPGKPAAVKIQAGSVTKVTAAFDDSQKMQ